MKKTATTAIGFGTLEKSNFLIVFPVYVVGMAYALAEQHYTSSGLILQCAFCYISAGTEHLGLLPNYFGPARESDFSTQTFTK
jgi:hypothetical protein